MTHGQEPAEAGRDRPEAAAEVDDALARQAGLVAALRADVTRKAAQIQERDHRIGNTLQVIVSLSLLKARRLPPGEAREALQAVAGRVGALALVERRLDGDGDAAGFVLGDFVRDLAADLTADLPPERIATTVAVEAFTCPAFMATALALILHELVANALRHAFPGDRTGSVRIEAACAEGELRLAVADDGVGLDRAPADASGFGRGLVELFAGQLRGRVAWTDAAPGTRVTLAVPWPAATA